MPNATVLVVIPLPVEYFIGAEFELPAKGVDLERVERSLVVQALRRCIGNQTRAGAPLGLNRDQIRYRTDNSHPPPHSKPPANRS